MALFKLNMPGNFQSATNNTHVNHMLHLRIRDILKSNKILRHFPRKRDIYSLNVVRSIFPKQKNKCFLHNGLY